MFWSALSRQAAAAPDAPALRASGRDFTYGALFGTVEALAPRLAARLGTPPKGVPPRCRIATTSQLATALAVLTCMRLGVTPVIGRPGMPDAQIAAIDALIHTVMVMEEADFAELPAPTATWDTAPRRAEDEELLLVFTSGTTGAPKASARPVSSLVTCTRTLCDAFELGPGDLAAAHMSLSYSYALNTVLLGTLFSGAELCLFETRQSPRQVLRGLRENGINVLFGPPSLHRLYLVAWDGTPFEDVRLVNLSSEPYTVALIEELGRAYPNARLVSHMGSSEGGSTIAIMELPDARAARGCLGRPPEHMGIRLEGVPDDAAGERGRLLISGPGVFLGYVQPDGGYAGLDEEGWFHTSDLVSRDAEGFLYHHGRADRLFKTMGITINPEEVEQAVRRHPKVADAMCLAEEDAVAGYVAVLKVQPHTGADLQPADILDHCRAVLERSQLPARIEMVERFAVAASGKRQAV